jgi:hypothetical protein
MKVHSYSPDPSLRTYLHNCSLPSVLSCNFEIAPCLHTTLDFAVPHERSISNMGALVSFITLPYHHISSNSVTYHCIFVLGIAFWGLLTPNNKHQFWLPKPAVKPKLIPKVIIGTQLNLSFHSFLTQIQLVYLLHLMDYVTTTIAHPNTNQPHCSFPYILTYLE